MIEVKLNGYQTRDGFVFSTMEKALIHEDNLIFSERLYNFCKEYFTEKLFNDYLVELSEVDIKLLLHNIFKILYCKRHELSRIFSKLK